MKNIVTLALAIALALGYFTSCNSGVQHRTFRGIYADDPAGMEGLYNPERGFRLEVALDVTEKNYVWAPEEYPDITSYLEEQSELYASDSVSLVQTYFYLTGAVGKDLTEADFRTMNIFLDKLRELGKYDRCLGRMAQFFSRLGEVGRDETDCFATHLPDGTGRAGCPDTGSRI